MTRTTLSPDMVGTEFPPATVSWDEKDAMLYALGVGARPSRDLDFVYEGRGPRVLPTFGVIPGMRAMGSINKVVQLPIARMLHGEQGITLALSLTRAVKHGWVPSISDYPLRRLYDERISLVLGSDMPLIYKNTLADELTALVDQLGFTPEEAEDIALNAVRASFLAEDAQTDLLTQFTDELAALRAEHLQPEAK